MPQRCSAKAGTGQLSLRGPPSAASSSDHKRQVDRVTGGVNLTEGDSGRPPNKHRPAVLLDRDGVIIRNRPHYVKNWSEAAYLPGAIEGLVRLSCEGFLLAVVTNQSGVDRGLVSEKVVTDIHERIAREVEKAGGRIHGFFVCPHTPEVGCLCRKPRPGLLLQAKRELDIDLANAYMIGDQLSDVEAAKAVGCRPILLVPRQEASLISIPGVKIVDDLRTAAAWILSRSHA
jgi:D-glycero-D-manno-heptose 1,7-bisphosphate phosphatase